MRTSAIQPVSCVAVADEATTKGTKIRSIRIDPDLWDDLDNATKAVGHDRSGVIRQFVRWYLRVPGAELPQRPGTTS